MTKDAPDDPEKGYVVDQLELDEKGGEEVGEKEAVSQSPVKSPVGEEKVRTSALSAQGRRSRM